MSIYHKLGERPHVVACSVFGGRSPKTGKPVGSRHRWGDNGRCEFCGRWPAQVRSTLEGGWAGQVGASARGPREP